MLIRSNRLDDFKKNPQMFIDGAIAIIKNVMSKFVVDGIKYHRLGESDIWAQELFESEELTGYIDQNMVATPHNGIYEYTVYDSDIEREFAERLNANEDVKVFAKLPDWFKIPTPLGTYNPDWAILVEKEGQKRLYFVVETKGTDLFGELPPPQQAKIKCGEAHFAALADAGNKFKAPVERMNPSKFLLLNKAIHQKVITIMSNNNALSRDHSLFLLILLLYRLRHFLQTPKLKM